MYVNMKTDKLTVPLNDEGKLDLGLTRIRANRKANVLAILGVFLLVVINIFLFVETTLALSRVKTLEEEVDLLKISVNDLKLQSDIINAIADFENDVYEDPEEQTEAASETLSMSPDEYDDDMEYDYDHLNETAELDRIIENLRLATNLTKDGKENSRTKRNVVAATEDGVIINSESYAERKAKNNTRRDRYRLRGQSITAMPARPSSFGSSPYITPDGYSSELSTSMGRSYSQNIKSPRRTPPPVYVRQSRVMHRNDKLKTHKSVRKSALKSGDEFSEEVTSSPDVVIVRDLGRRSRMGRVRLPAIHYNGDTSKYVMGQHTNFNGNGHLKHPQGTFVDWKVSDWATSSGMDSYFTMDEGILTIKDSGIYFIYAQIYYLDEHDVTGFRVYKNRNTVLLQCTSTVHSRERALIGNTCYTAGAEYLSEGDTITLSDVSTGRYSLFEPGKSFFGLIKLSDIKLK
ncbi:protein eiger [Anoplophora glabripennis]|uniref:protein eiger n=1 Tax=Anoplophora glabripennis TaxID=217634 RepID=UPI000874805F|nr:protein eiger [Anoplophora glabripennis]